MSRLAPPDPAWPRRAEAEIARWRASVAGLVTVHHIGSTAVPGLAAKPILDLLPVFADDATADAGRRAIETLGYAWMVSYGLPGRRYCRRDDPATGLRVVQAHGYTRGHPDIARHLAFRDLLRARTDLRDSYGALKAACAAAHRGDGAGYGACKSAWIDRMERLALET